MYIFICCCNVFSSLSLQTQSLKNNCALKKGMLQIKNDWSYLFFLIPSIISFIFSCSVIFKVLLNQNNLKKKFHQLTLLIALFDFIQCFSWFIGPRYETNTKICQGQEYLFQIGSLGQGIISIIICTTISQAIQYGTVPSWHHKRIYVWIIFFPICILFSILFNTGTMFCPFNENNELYHPNITSNSSILSHLIAYILCYLFPLLLCCVFTVYYTIRSTYSAYSKSNKALYQVISQLRLYPIMLTICISPIASYFITIIVTGYDCHQLLFIGAILASSSGLINGLVYFFIIKNSKERPYSQNGFPQQMTSSFLMTENMIKKKKHKKNNKGSKLPTSPEGTTTEEEQGEGGRGEDEEDLESSYHSYYGEDDRGSSAVSDTRMISYSEDISECNAQVINQILTEKN